MPRRHRHPADRRALRQSHLGVEGLEARVVLAAGIGYDRATRVLAIVGSSGDDVAEVRQQGTKVVVSLDSAAGRFSRSLRAAQVARVVFLGHAGNDTFTNRTAIASRADGGADADMLRGGRGGDELIGGDGGDMLHGGAGNDLLLGGGGGDELLGGSGEDALQAGTGDDRLDGELGRDQLVGGDGLDREVDTQDGFVDGDLDGDGFDNDHDFMDILYESPGNPPAYADDATVAPVIASVAVQVRGFLQIPTEDAGLRVRVSREPFGALVTGVWRYLTPDKIQVWGRWAYPAADPAQLQVCVQYSYTGPYSGDIADYTDPANYVVSAESRIYAGYLSGPTTFVSWLPGAPASFYYSAPGESATGFPAPLEALRAALATMPNFTSDGESFAGDFSSSPGLPGVRPVLELLRTIDRITRASRPRLAARPV